MPEELWQEAVRVAGDRGVWATAHAARLKYESLKARVRNAASNERTGEAEAGTAKSSEASGQASGALVSSRRRAEAACRVTAPDERGRAGAGAGFVALRLAPPLGGGPTTIELVGRRGDRMRIDVAGGVDLVGMAQAFWGRAS